MTIKPDRWIRQMSTRPTHVVERNGRPERFLSAPYSHSEKLMIKSWQEAFEKTGSAYHDLGGLVIRPFTENDTFQPMIEPFVRGQVRRQDGVDSSRIISYGNSSYGYDARCATEFKVFTNINSAIVDPKHFDDKCFIDIEGESCIIPPNSFALARTVEYFRIPEDVLVICLGKSTYARCFTGDTQVALVDGTSVSFTEMVERSQHGERFWGYSVDNLGNIVVAELTAPRKVGHETVLEVELDNGETIRCTPDHNFMLRDGRYVEAKDLTEGESLMPLYRGVTRGYEAVYQPASGQMVSTHWLADAWNVANGVYENAQKTHRHHKDHDRRNNRPDNIERVSASEHLSYHNAERWNNATVEQREEHGDKVAEALAVLKDDEAWFENFCFQQRAKASAFWTLDKYKEERERLLASRKHVSAETRAKMRASSEIHWSKAGSREKHGGAIRRAWSGDSLRRKAQAALASTINRRDEITAEVVDLALKAAGTIRGAAERLGCDRSVFRRFPEVLETFKQRQVLNNHKVAAVRAVDVTEDVYCLTVPEHGNFALESGLFVKNCGIIVNVTPLEPGWEGHVTLEFSNTTNLPAKIYANEGVCQFLFFQSDERCDVSYKDRGGKYMGQRGVTRPRM